MEDKVKKLEDIMKKFWIMGALIALCLGFLVFQTVSTNMCLTSFIEDDFKNKAAEIIGRNVKDEISSVEIYKEWDSQNWTMSIGNLKYTLMSKVGRKILVDHFGEEEILKLEAEIYK